MRELRTQEGRKFERFFSLVRDASDKVGCIFFVDCGEGRELFTEDMEGEDLSGWLIPKEKAAVFEKEFRSGDVSEEWNDRVFFATWSQKDNSIAINFESY